MRPTVEHWPASACDAINALRAQSAEYYRRAVTAGAEAERLRELLARSEVANARADTVRQIVEMLREIDEMPVVKSARVERFAREKGWL